MVYDLIIIGASAAGIASGIYAARRNLNFIVISKDVGGEVAKSGEVWNYPGYPKTDGIALSEKFKEHLLSNDVTPETVVTVRGLKKDGDKFHIEADKNGEAITYEAKSVIVATGVEPRHLGIPGEDEFRGKGVTYCTTCDGPLFRGKIVATVGGGNSALESALMLSEIGSKVYLINRNEEMAGETVLIDKVMAAKNIELVTNAETSEIRGEQFVSGLKYKDKSSGEEKELEVQGVFVHIGNIPNSGMFDIVEKNKFGEIMVDRLGKTNVEGLFAAGDVTDIPYKQIAIATGMGVVAVLSAVNYLNNLK
ncbi:FAD-dependent oxidoreductase [Patescibacteria group bacterium]|nr:FAD-dependent oxidoreductase [Patescibacteria group bacterium]